MNKPGMRILTIIKIITFLKKMKEMKLKERILIKYHLAML